jgi:hypothetical protein
MGGGRIAMLLPILSLFAGLKDYIDSLFNWPPAPQGDQGELIWVSMTLAVSFGAMIMLGRWWQR